MNDLNEIIELLAEIINKKPTYSDTEQDVYRLQGKQDLAEEILDLIKFNQKLEFKGVNPKLFNLNDELRG